MSEVPPRGEWAPDMGEISGFGKDGTLGGRRYENCCRDMLRAGLAWLDAHPSGRHMPGAKLAIEAWSFLQRALQATGEELPTARKIIETLQAAERELLQERDDARAQLAAVTRERNEARVRAEAEHVRLQLQIGAAKAYEEQRNRLRAALEYIRQRGLGAGHVAGCALRGERWWIDGDEAMIAILARAGVKP